MFEILSKRDNKVSISNRIYEQYSKKDAIYKEQVIHIDYIKSEKNKHLR